jgi:hypothetical protein
MEELNTTMNYEPNIVEQYVFVCNIGCKNVQSCPEIVQKLFNFYVLNFFFWSGRPVTIQLSRRSNSCNH